MSSKSQSGSSTTFFRSPRGQKWLFALALAALAIILYASATRFSFLNYDDDKYVTANPHVQAGLTAESLRWSLTAHVVGHWQPVTLLSHMLDCQFYGVSPSGHHLSSVMLHALNALLLFLVLASLTRAAGLSFLVAALFAVHPLNIENVAWIAERKTLVSALFSLLAIATYQWFAARPNLRRWLLVTACFVLALASKATAITLPVIFLGLDCWPLNRIEGFRNSSEPSTYPVVSVRRLMLEKAPLFVLCGLSAWITIVGQEQSEAIASVPLLERVAHASWSYVVYLAKLAWPSQIAILYPYSATALWQGALGLLFVVGVSAIVFRLRCKRVLVAGWLFYLISMLPVIGLIQVGHQSFADHFLYLPEVGIFMMFAWGAKEIADRFQIGAGIQKTFVTAVVVAFAAITAANLPYWTNSFTVFAHAEKVAGTSDFVIENNLAQGLVELGRPTEAIPHYLRAVALAPNDPLPRYNLAARLAETGDTTGAIEQYTLALTHSPNPDLRQHILHNLATAYATAGDLTHADETFSAAIELYPESAISLFGRGQVRFREGRFHDAAEDFTRAAALQPLPEAYYWIGKSAVEEGRRDDAVRAYTQALRMDPRYTQAQQELVRLKGQ